MATKEKDMPRGGVIPYYIDNTGTEPVIKMLFMVPSDAKYGGSAWQIAKGKIEKGETPEEGAFREASEELGLFGPNIVQKYELGKFGKITMFVAKIKDHQLFGEPHHETGGVNWMTPKEFQNKGRDWQRPIVKAAVRLIKKKEKKITESQLDEIEMVVDQTPGHVNVDAYKFADATVVGKVEPGLILVKSEHNGTIGFAIIKNNVPVASVYGNYALNKPNYFVIQFAWVDPKFRRQGFLSTLYMGLVRRVGLKLVSDNQQTASMKALWNNLLRDKQKVVNTDTWEIQDRTDVPDSEIYGKGKDNIRLIIEHNIKVPNKHDRLGIPLKYHERVIIEGLEYNPDDDIIGEYEFYTHPNFKGIYM